jgi:hypothetical protein
MTKTKKPERFTHGNVAEKITHHACIRFLERHEGIKLKKIVEKLGDTETLEVIEKESGLLIEELKQYIELICTNYKVGFLSNSASYNISNKCKAVLSGGYLVTITKNK